jgi:hypothetical protein
VAYRVAPNFLIRMAGAPFDLLDALATTQTSKAARELLDMGAELSRSRSDVARFVRDLPKELARAWKKTIRSGAPSPAEPATNVFENYRQLAGKMNLVRASLHERLRRELYESRAALLRSAANILPDYLVFCEPAMRARILKELAVAEPPPRNKNARAHERHLLLYLQRVCAKNDSLSAFGPEGWGHFERVESTVRFAPQPGISQRETFLERWTAHVIVGALNADPEIRPELCPRIHPNGRIERKRFVFVETGDAVELDDQTVELLSRCDGQTPAHSLGENSLSILEHLANEKIIRWKAEVPGLDPYAFDAVVANISRWRETPVRSRWLETLQPLAELPRRFATAKSMQRRSEIMDEANARLSDIGAARQSTRFLYAATNPIGEECVREGNFSVDENAIDEAVADAAPWIDLWRDSYAFVASRVAAGLRRILRNANPTQRAIPLPAFLRLCEKNNLPLTGPGLVALAAIAFEEVKAAFRERLRPHLDLGEYELTHEDCHFVRNNFEYPKFDEYTYPAADWQISAESVEALAAGDYQWILAELHPPVALLHHGFYWACPDKPALNANLARTVFGRPNFHFGFFAADFTATTAVYLPEVLPDVSYFVAPEPGKPHWKNISPANAEVFVDPETEDVCLREIGTEKYLGSFARSWLIPLGFHPFQFSMAPQMPRLRCGKVIVQRRSWIVTLDEFAPGTYSGVSSELVVAIEQLRATQDLPRFVYIRPTEKALRRSGAEGRDKDTKPVFVDLESYLFMEIFHRWLTKAGELEVTEMLPDPSHLFWKGPDGRRTFEIRTLIVPAP